MKDCIYLDFAATTPLDPLVLEAMQPYLLENWGNPSSAHSKGRDTRSAIDRSRQSVADAMQVKPEEVIFTASGSEANSLALFGVCEKWVDTHGKPGHMAVLSIEHHCSLKATDRLKKLGWKVSMIPVDDEGILDPLSLEKVLQDDTAIVSVQWANNEVGTTQPIEEVHALCKQRGVYFHTDAVQPIGQLAIPTLPDLTTIAAHKFYGPKGMGALIVRDHVEIAPQILGGGQEFDLRAGTENTPGIVGFAKALELAIENEPLEQKRLITLRDNFIETLTTLPNVTLNGHAEKRLPNNINVRFSGNLGETIVIQLDMQGICAATGSACATGSSEPSHVLEAMGRDETATSENVRFSLGRSTTKTQLDTVFNVLQEILSV